MKPRSQLLLILLLSFAFASLAFVSLDINRHLSQVYVANISTKPGSGILKIVFYSGRYTNYINDSSIEHASDDWDVMELTDCVILTPRSEGSTLRIRSYGSPVYLNLLRYREAGVLTLSNGHGFNREIDLHSETESIDSMTIGGDDSLVPSIPGDEFLSPARYYSAYVLVLGIFIFIAIYQLKDLSSHVFKNERHLSEPLELLGYCAPLLVSTFIVQLAFWPASVPHDGGQQWMEAVVPGTLSSALVVTATLLFRLFAKLSINPAYAILIQIALGALGVSLILYEIRQRGVPWRITQLAAILIAILPQYPTFITILSKDAWNCIGILIATYASLSLMRHVDGSKPTRPLFLLAMAILMIFAAAFAGAMRPNTIPPILVYMLFMLFYFRRKLGLGLASVFFAIYLLSVYSFPKLAIEMSAEHAMAQSQSVSPQSADTMGGLPLGVYSYWYILHLFSAAIHSNVPIPPEDAEVFFKLAPPEAWKKYDCAVHDKTQDTINQMGMMNNAARLSYFKEHQAQMIRIVTGLGLKYPAFWLERQTCATRILWYIGFKLSLFQVNTTIGYDSVPANFIEIAGPNLSLIGKGFRNMIIDYVSWSEAWNRAWLFWKPFLFTCFGFFSVILYSIVQSKRDVLVVIILPVMLIVSLGLLISFPAFRYPYPATLIFTLFFLFSFAKHDQASKRME